MGVTVRTETCSRILCLSVPIVFINKHESWVYLRANFESAIHRGSGIVGSGRSIVNLPIEGAQQIVEKALSLNFSVLLFYVVSPIVATRIVKYQWQFRAQREIVCDILPMTNSGN